ncbi:hypothetical protein KGM_208164 [Danaus plexippus plexippus]|uniref:Kazal-like domain-containing protein n=1 Tax=Danaus plexippus plexippus TaxID=278856 RepID=A0A212FH46_DANPL|nr:hypothetical protein KGM_208164 [Danaus plexippus plexippus]
MYQLMVPYIIPNKTRPKDLDQMNTCECPRVYWPACATDNITYVNVCILLCLNKTLRRYGPCITYRRNFNKKIRVYVPSIWKVRRKRVRI